MELELPAVHRTMREEGRHCWEDEIELNAREIEDEYRFLAEIFERQGDPGAVRLQSLPVEYLSATDGPPVVRWDWR